MKLKYKFASSNTLDGIKHMIIEFFCGNTSVELIERDKNWEVSRIKDGVRRVSPDAIVLRQGKRYVFGQKE